MTESAEFDRSEKAERRLLEIMEAIAAVIEPGERTARLIAWARSPWFSFCGMLCEGWQGELHRDADAALQKAMGADTPAMAWRRADHKRGRASIFRALQIDPEEPHASDATLPFRILNTAEDECWIAAATGPLRFHQRGDPCPELDIDRVILWNPASGASRLLGEAASASSIVLPDPPRRQLTLYADPRAFLRAWADRRAEMAERRRSALVQTHGLRLIESRDSGIPGAFIVGDLGKVRLPLDAGVLEAGPGIDARRLSQAVYRQADLPRVQAIAA